MKFSDLQLEIMNDLVNTIATTFRKKKPVCHLDYTQVDPESAAALRGLKQRGYVTYTRSVVPAMGYWASKTADYTNIHFTSKGWTEFATERVFRLSQPVSNSTILAISSLGNDLRQGYYELSNSLNQRDYAALSAALKKHQDAMTKLNTQINTFLKRIETLSKRKPDKQFQAKIIAAMMGV